VAVGCPDADGRIDSAVHLPLDVFGASFCHVSNRSVDRRLNTSHLERLYPKISTNFVFFKIKRSFNFVRLSITVEIFFIQRSKTLQELNE
jgi:hypothetical protein